jgi:hypothetical protein
MSGATDTLGAELQRLSTADRLVDVSAVPETTTQRCEGLLLRCDQPAPVHVALEEDVGLRTWHFEHDLCPGCALVVIGLTSAAYVDVEVRIPAIGGAA